MKEYKGYFIDLDGTLYRGTELIPEALEFVRELDQKGIPHLYLTNNSSRTPEQVADKLRQFGFPARPGQVYTTALATAQYVQENFPDARVYVIGEEGLLQALKEKGCRITEEHPNAVVVGIDRGFTYKKMKKACLAIRAGATLIGTNADRALPTEEGLLPGSGSLVAGISAATGVKPLFIGKPEPIILRYALKKLGVAPEEVLIVGDNLDTDIRAGIEGGMDTLLVFTGITTPEMAEKAEIKATYTARNLREWMNRANEERRAH
ncbi:MULTISPECIES: TIGR01457 family HAD-type hydrolase [unclassified Thermoactinomyces]|uniref:TIGR01457 family HAD-type hydrolase n=1 Tax=unclassified Thermoactinomyces TaxID=2634588 RepID=UPI0018DCB1FA|nr:MULTISPECIES: TIGR01457 family HAD-type hydrolase [unclassified Thermoactinomyces]MBH8598954.1 TIGR01457 family HAD-type hydrolase [Thermoactinomyces sp. CICC 10523]MBH8604940.1 TIGR01457 family HAD-type hydrolase [Thermoactinomyces sp. CICC 10522]